MCKLFSIAILCGGQATRLQNFYPNLAKSMIEINGKPFIHWQLEKLKKSGFDRVVLCVGNLSEQIINYIGNGSKWDLYVSYSVDKNLLGTGGALKQSIPILDDYFFVQYGDSYLNLDYKEVQRKYIEKNKLGLMAVYKNNNQLDKSNVSLENDIVSNYDKHNSTDRMEFIDYGVGIFHKSAFNDYKGKFDLAEVYERLVNKKELIAYRVKSRFYEIGSLQGIEDFKNYIKEK